MIRYLARTPYKRNRGSYWQLPGKVSVHLKPTVAHAIELGAEVVGILHIVIDKGVPIGTVDSFVRNFRKNVKLPKGVNAVITTDQIEMKFIKIGRKKKGKKK